MLLFSDWLNSFFHKCTNFRFGVAAVNGVLVVTLLTVAYICLDLFSLVI